jgi:serine phosphatase RsbU (regulator of sigma subunit)
LGAAASSQPLGGPLRTAAFAAAAVTVAVLVSQAIEIFINRVLRPNAAELSWISEAIMAAAFLVMTTLWVRLRRTRRELSEAQRVRVALETQLAVAASVQRALLPPTPEPIDGIAWFAAVEPAGLVGGDYYDFVRLSNGNMCVVLGDVSGKGIAAAVFLSNVRALVRALLRETHLPADLLRRLSDAVLEDSRAGLYVTCFLAIVDARARQLTYANAGHPTGVIIGNGGVRALDVGGPPAGLLPTPHYQAADVTLADDEVVVIVSDGITEALDTGGTRIPSALASAIGTTGPRSPEAVGLRLFAAAQDGLGPDGVADWSDDRTVVTFGAAS